jgi:hypothetical protein
MRRLAPLLGLVLLIVWAAPMAFAGERATIDAYLDATCTTLNGAFTVAPGTVATHFSATMSSPWRACSVDYPIDTIGFMIVDDSDKRYYVYMQYKDGSSQEFEGSLSTLVLKPGSYHVYVQGGLDTRARVTFDVLTEKTLLTP